MLQHAADGRLGALVASEIPGSGWRVRRSGRQVAITWAIFSLHLHVQQINVGTLRSQADG
ncbi:hypothetical protein RvY_04591 [Ramazzottius varieornatus]|uniref:Uncharacterized protein n=1 Tax=Ramazzottius varieornatus TaxID=947166 RepID=A0A1D1UVG4_RAMVA|nr:hypothetical protein RvY_04591 [Ramazzottius varieornatus]